MSNVSSVVNYFPTANEGFSTTLGSTISAGAVTVPLGGTAGLTDASVFVGIIEPGATNQQVFTGTVSVGSSSIINVVWTRGTNVPHTGGVTIVDYVTGTALNMISAGILKDHVQLGGHNVLHDVNNNVWIDQGAASSAVNHIKVANAASGASPTISVTGGDTNIDLTFTPKGTGQVKGMVDHLFNPYKFSVYQSVGTTIASGFVYTKVGLQTKNFDTGGNFDNVTNFRFTAPVSGFYHFIAKVDFFVINNIVVQCALFKNTGTIICQSPQALNITGGSNVVGSTISRLVQLTAGDYIEVFGRTNQGTNSNTNTGNEITSLDGFLVSTT